MKAAAVVSFATTVAGHAALIGMGPEKCRQSPRTPDDETLVDRLSGTDGKMNNLMGIRCVAAPDVQKTTLDKIQGWCSQSGDWTNSTRDQGFCFGTTPNTHTKPNSVLKDVEPKLWGHDTDCTWNAGDDIRVSVHFTQQHEGSHFVDFVPQNKEQLEGLPPCPGSKRADGTVEPFMDVNRRIEDFKVCYQDGVNAADEKMEDWQRKTIRLHPAFAVSPHEVEASKSEEYKLKKYAAYENAPVAETEKNHYRIDYHFKLPNLKFDASKPAVFRWVWVCGYDVQCGCTPKGGEWMHNAKPPVTPGDQCPHPDYIQYGMGEIFINCADIKQVNPAPATTATSAAPSGSQSTSEETVLVI